MIPKPLKITRGKVLQGIAVLFLLATSIANAQSITTLFDSNNAFAGNSFDMENLTSQPIRVDSFEVNLSHSGSTNTIAIYWREGTSDGFTNDPAGWILMGKDTNVVSQGTDSPTPVAIGGLMMNPGQVYGIYVDLESYDGTTSVRYTNSAGPVEHNDGKIKLTTFYGRSNVAFTPGGDFIHRIWNGTVYYSLLSNVPVPVLGDWRSLLLLVLLLGLTGIFYQRRVTHSNR